ncbi:hypothetical protein CKO25_10190 [Thiocapsa imhoffii]|uniref:DUF4124 domain-containing protein n=1 Tax=Thiocapsa imhoffii TaxID=382777 RepID=A0A9X0WI54_9GAMM|nr:DUF4124 domain-containing protein [Thiocapsa imhoffii]MBK1645013.1 hypothetical protein [Thiocapsa imhoffii]
MRVLLFTAIGLLTSSLHAEVFRWVDEDGRTHFSDRLPENPSLQVERADLDTGTAAALLGPVAASAEEDLLPGSGPYDAFDILAPSPGAVLVQATDTLAINVLLEPPLLDEHTLELVLDDRTIAVEAGVSALELEGVGFGPHQLQLRITDANGQTIASTPTHDLDLQETTPPGILR